MLESNKYNFRNCKTELKESETLVTYSNTVAWLKGLHGNPSEILQTNTLPRLGYVYTNTSFTEFFPSFATMSVKERDSYAANVQFSHRLWIFVCIFFFAAHNSPMLKK